MAVVDTSTGLVLNVIEWMAGSTWEPPAGTQLIEAANGAGPGYTWDGTQRIFKEPDRKPAEPPDHPELTRAELIAAANARLALGKGNWPALEKEQK